MKHNIRINGKIQTLDFEISSGLLDCNGREIFEGDIVRTSGYEAPADFSIGSFWHGKIELSHYVDDEYLEVVGHIKEGAT